MSRGYRITAVLLGILVAVPGGSAAGRPPPGGAPCNASQLVLEARRFVESNRPARVPLERLLRALNECPDESVAFDLNLYLAVTLMHEGRIPEARLAADRAQANAWDDEQAARAGAVQIALRDLVGEVVFALPSAQAGGDLELQVADPKSLPPNTVLDEAFPREKAFARGTFDAMVGAAQAHLDDSTLQLVTVYLPAGLYRLSTDQVFRVGAGTTNIEVKPTERWQRSIGLTAVAYTSITPIDSTTVAVGHRGSIGFGLVYSHAVGRRLMISGGFRCSPLEIRASSGTGDAAGTDAAGGSDGDGAGAPYPSTLNAIAQELVAGQGFHAWNAAAHLGVGWPVAVRPGRVWLVPRVGLGLMWMEGVLVSSASSSPAEVSAEASASDAAHSPAFGIVGEWMGGMLNFDLALHWTLPTRLEQPVALVLVLDGGVGTGWIRGTQGPAVPIVPATFDVMHNAIATGGAFLAVDYQF